jgi:PAS domain S-box-containing protein
LISINQESIADYKLAKSIIRVLHLDDEEDQQIFLKVFVEGDPNIKITSAKNAEDILLLVQTDAYDCLITDYDMPNMDGITLAIKVRKISKIPIILYTGRGSEEIAEKAYSVGINDYIRKENHPAHYQVLAERIRQTVERNRAEKALRESEERYRALVEKSPYAISVTIGNKIVYANPSRAKLAGVDDASKLIGTPSQLQVAEQDRPVMKNRGKMRENGKTPSSPFSFQLVAPDGSIRYIVDYSSEIVYEGEKALQHLLMDVTENKMFQERLETLHRNELELVDAETIDDVAELTLDAIERTLGFDQCYFGFVEGDELRFRHSRGIQGVVNLPLSERGITVRAVKSGETQLVSDIRKDADFIDAIDAYQTLSEMAVPVRVGDRIVAVLNLESSRLDAYTSDDQKLVEILSENVASAISRINQMEVIRESEETYKILLNSSLELVALVTGTTITYINDWAVKLLGYDSPHDLIGKDISQVIPVEVLPVIRDRALSRQRGESQPSRYELKLLSKSGRVMPVDASLSLIMKQGKMSILVIGRNMTEMNRHKRQVTALHRHAAKLVEARTRDEIFNTTLDTVESVVGFHILSILEPQGSDLVLTYSKSEVVPNIRLPVDGKGLTVKAAKEKRSILTSDTELDPNYVRGSTSSRSELDVPIVLDGETVAVINLESEELNAFDETDRELMETLALNVSSAMRRIR